MYEKRGAAMILKLPSPPIVRVSLEAGSLSMDETAFALPAMAAAGSSELLTQNGNSARKDICNMGKYA